MHFLRFVCFPLRLCETVNGDFRWGFNTPRSTVFSPNLILYFPWNAEERPESPRDASEAKAQTHTQHRLCNTHKIFVFNNALSTEHAENKQNGFRWSETRRKGKAGRQKKREEEKPKLRSPWREIISSNEAIETELCIAVTSADFFLFATRFFGISRSEWTGYM